MIARRGIACRLPDDAELAHSGESVLMVGADPSQVTDARKFLRTDKALLAFEAYGVRLGVRSFDADVLRRLQPRLPPGWQPCLAQTVTDWFSLTAKLSSATSPHSSDASTYLYCLSAGSETLLRSHQLEAILHELDWRLRLAIALNVRDRLFVHAGVVGWQGRAIVIPGRSFSGKSSLVTALIEAGATYYSDEYAVFDAAGCVHPYHRRLSLREGIGKRPGFYSAEELGAVSGHDPLPVGLILVTHFLAGAQWQPKRLTPGDAMMALFENTVAARAKPQYALRTLGTTVRESTALVGPRGEAGEIVEFVRDAFCCSELSGPFDFTKGSPPS